MKNVYAFLMVVLLMLSSGIINAQNVGDFQSRGSRNWNASNAWQRFNGTSWQNNQGYPGETSGSGTVTILDGHNITLIASPTYAIAELVIATGNAATALTFNGGQTLNVTGDISVSSTSNNVAKSIALNAGTLSCANFYLTSTGGNSDNKDAFIVLTSGDLNVNGNITMNAVAARTYIRFNGGGIVDVGGIITGGNITSTDGGGTGAPTSGTVNYVGSGNRTLGNYTFYNLGIDKATPSTTVTSSSQAFTVSNDLTVTRGNLILEATDDHYTVGRDLSVEANGMLTHNVSWDGSGKLLSVGRNLSIAGTYNYPVPRAHLQMTGGGTKTINTGSSALSILTLQTGNYLANGTVTVNDNFWAMFGTTGSFSTNGQSVSAKASLLINGGTVNINGGALNVTGGVSVGTGGLNGALTMSSGTLNVDNIAISPACTFTCTGSPQINITGDLTNNGTFTGAGSNITLAGNANQSIAGFTTTGTVSNTKTGGTATLQGNVNGSGLSVGGSGGALDLGTGLSHTFSGAFNLSNGTINGGSSTLRLGGAVNVTGGAFTSGSGTVEYYGGAQTVPGTNYHNLTISGGNTKTLNGSARVNGNLNLNNGILALGSNDLTLSAVATASGTFSATRMIDVGSGSVIKEGNINDHFKLSFPIGMGANYTPVTIANFSATSILPGSTLRVRSFASAASGVNGAKPLNRHWLTSTTGISGSVLADISFDYIPSDIPVGGTAGKYEILYKPTAGVWGIPGGASAAGINPLRASAATTLDATWTGAEPVKQIFYSFKTGSWDDASTWTLDPSGTQLLNPNSVTPATSPTSLNDEVVILSGRTVTISANSKSNKSLSVIGTLNVGTTSGHSFTTISGTGRIRLAADNFPAGDATHFVTAGQGEGVVEYYGSSRSLNIARSYYNVDVNMTAANTLTLMRDYTIGGNLTITNGTFSINNNAATTPLSITVKGDVLVTAQGKIATGIANARHQLNLYGNFTNNGEARFTNRTAPNYTNEANDGIVDVNFLNGSKDQSILCRGITNFYRIEIDKGIDQTYTLNLDATNVDNFKLFGYAGEDHGSESQLAENNNAFGLVRGTVRIGNSIEIPMLSSTASTGNYNISENAQLWIDGGKVIKISGTAIVVYGKIKVSNGTLDALISSGLTFRGNGIINIEGGTVNANQIRTSVIGTSNYGGYIQTGGTVNVIGGSTSTDHYVFSLPASTSVFNMSGGTLKVNTSNGKGGIFINSAAENIKVTGGTVIAETSNDTQDFLITSTAPFWNLLLKNSTTVARKFTLGPAVNVGTNVNVDAQPLRVLNDFRIWGKETGGGSYPVITFEPGITDVYIGGSFFIENGAQYTPISGGTAPYDAIGNQPTTRNTTYFIKTAATGAVEELYRGDAANPLELGNLVIDRTAGHEVKMTSSATRTNESIVLDINGNASVLSGTLNQNLFTIRTWGAITNNGRMGTWYPGVTPSRAQIQLVENPALTLSTSSNAVFGNVQVNVTPPSVLTFTSDVYIERMEYVKGLIYLKGYNLKVDNLWQLDPAIFENSATNSYLKVLNTGHSGSSMIYTDGKASDGGLTLRVAANSQPDENQPNRLNNTGPTTYPLGFTTDGGTTRYFRPAQIMVQDYSTPGYVSIRPVLGALPTTNQSGTSSVLQHYWRVSHSGFSALPKVSFRFYYRNRTGVANVDLSSGTDANYVPGKVLDESPYTRQFEPLAHNDIVRAFGEGNNSRFMTVNGIGTTGQFSHAAGGVTLENANYTAGEVSRFSGSVLIYYSRDYNQQAQWNDNRAWTRSDVLDTRYGPHDSRQPAASSVPGAGDVAVIGWIPWTDEGRSTLKGQPHGMWITDTRQVAEVVFTKMTDAGGNPVSRVYRSNFQFRPTLTIDGGNGKLFAKLVKGEGLFWNRSSDPDFTIMDIGDFARQDSSYVLYENFNNNRVIYNTPALLPNLLISNDGWGANNHNFTFAKDIVTTGNVELIGNVNLLLPTGAKGDITVGRDLVMFVNQNSGSGAEIGYGNSGTARKIVVEGDVIMANANSVINVRGPNTTGGLVDHELHVHGNIIQGTAAQASTGLRLWTAADQDRITLYLGGNSNMTYNRVNGTIPALYRVVVHKGTSQATTARFNTDFTLNGSTSGVGIPKALELQNGTFIYSNTNASRVLDLTTGNDNFNIPSTAGLEIQQGTVRANGTSGISLDGLLTISGGTLDMSGGDNPIEYSASGNATISVTNGTLSVGGQIRRSATSDVGILKYQQTGGTVIAGNNAATVNNRGVFEVLNQGSSFNMTGGDLYIARSQTSPTISAFYFNPDVYSIDALANIHIGHSSTPASQTIGIYAGKPMPGLRINNTSTRNPIAKLEVVPAVINSLLRIDAGVVLDANGLNLTLNGNMDAFGTFTPNGNTTYFSGSADQTINGGGTAVNFHNIDKTASNNLLLSTGNTQLIVSNNLSLHAGIFTDNGNTISLKGNLLNNAIHVNSGSGDGISLNGNIPQILEGIGTFGKLTINNPNGVNMPVGSQFTITKSLKMQAGILNIESNLLIIGQDGVIEQASPFSAANMIETNLSFTDNGVRKVFRPGTSQFTFPVGSNNKYTPVIFDVTANSNNGGSITVKLANEKHTSIIEDVEAGVQIVDKDNALQYYWTLTAQGMVGFSADAKMGYVDTDAKITAPYTIADYHTASLLADGEGKWLKFPKADFDQAIQQLKFKFTNASDAKISGDYTAGAGDVSLDGAIPNEVSKYETVKGGDWIDGSVWNPNLSGGPYGAIAKINSGHTVVLPANPVSEYMTEVYGTIVLNSTFGHRLGIVNGTGTISLETGQIPAAVYDSFFSSAGGTLEFGGASGYELLGNVSMVNHLKLSGTGERRLPNNDLTLNGNLTIDGGLGLDVINYYSQRLGVKGNLSRTTGSFEAGSGANATLAFIGTLTQTISGSFSNANALNNFEINNANSVTVTNDVEIDRELKLINGRINVASGSLFRINYGASVSPVAGSSSSFVNGTLTKELMTGNSFTFPVGDLTNFGPVTVQNVTGPAGVNDWKVSYYYDNATLDGYDTESFGSSISTVSHSEYWKMEAPTGGASKISITLNGSSDVASSAVNLSNIKVVGWNATSKKWEIVGAGATVSGTATSGKVTTTASVNYGSYTYFTLASITPVVTGTATMTSAPVVNICAGSSTTIKVTFSGLAPYVLTYNAGATSITPPPISATSYEITVSPSTTTVYTLTSITANGVAGIITGNKSTTVNVSPIPVVLLSRSGSGNICEGTGITFTATPGLANYIFRVDGTMVQNSAINTYTTTSFSSGIKSVDVTGTNSSGCSATSSAITVDVNPLPAVAGAISGPASVCRSSNVIYSVPAIADATGYTWSATNGATISGSGATRTITFPTAGTSIITVRGTNGCGNGAPSTFNVAVNTASTPGAAGTIAGASQVCRGGIGYAFTVGGVSNATSYIWSYSGTGATINGTGNSVTIDFAAGATAGNLTVRGTNGCSDGGISPVFAITTSAPPTATLAPASPTVCSGSSLIITATPAGGTPTYTHAWTGAGAGSLSSTSINNPSFANGDGGNYDLIYTVTDSKGCRGSAVTTVIVSPAPVANAGPDALDLCTGTSPVAMTGATVSGSYTGTPTWSGTGGDWTQNPDPALATFTPSTSSGSTIATLTLIGANGCANVTDTREMSWSKAPDQPAAFVVSSSSVCQGEDVIYTVPNDLIATSYNWNYTGVGATINGNGNSVTLNFSSSATSGTLRVTATNSCNTSAARTLDIIVKSSPAVTLISDADNGLFCVGTSVAMEAAEGLSDYIFRVNNVDVAQSASNIFVSSSFNNGDIVVVRANYDGGCYGVSNQITLNTHSFSDTWTGLENSEWTNPANWCDGVVPSPSADITVNRVVAPQANPVITTYAQFNNLTIAPNASLTLNPGAKLTINGNLVTNDKLIVKNTVAQPASIITHGTVTGNTNVQWPLTQRAWWYIGHSVTGVAEADYDGSFGAEDYALNQYDGKWNRIAGTGDMNPGNIYSFNKPLEGYSLTIKETGKMLSYNGVLNADVDYQRQDYYPGWHLIANPYPSYIDVSQPGFDMGDFRKTVYIRKSDNQVSTYSMLTGVGLLQGSKYISPGQCIWLRTYTDNDKVVIPSSIRTHNPDAYGLMLKSGSYEPSDRLRLSLESEYGIDESVVIFNQYGSEIFTVYDSEKLMNGGNIANLYSLKSGKEIAINSLPELANGTVIPLAYQVAAKGISPMTIKVTNMDEFMPEVMVYLVDNVAGTTIDLRETPFYTFTPTVATANDRFELRFETSISTAVDEDIKESVTKNQVLIYGVKQRAHIKVGQELLNGTDKSIKVYNVAGQLMATHELNNEITEFDLPQRDAAFIIRVNIDGVTHKAVVIGMD